MLWTGKLFRIKAQPVSIGAASGPPLSAEGVCLYLKDLLETLD